MCVCKRRRASSLFLCCPDLLSPVWGFSVCIQILQLESTPEKHILSWQGQLLPSWMGLVERVQEVTPSEDGQSCTLKSWESFAGWISYIFKYAMGIPKQLEESNVRYSNDLKAYAEKLYREGSSNTS